jgi:predicted ArsR family transcriptional regulator
MSKPGPDPTVTGEDVVGVFRHRDDQSEPLTASEVAEQLDCSRRTALNQLNELAEAGEISSKKVGARARVYWMATAQDDNDAPAAPLRGLVGMMSDEEVDALEEHQHEVREEFDERMHGA